MLNPYGLNCEDRDDVLALLLLTERERGWGKYYDSAVPVSVDFVYFSLIYLFIYSYFGTSQRRQF